MSTQIAAPVWQKTLLRLILYTSMPVILSIVMDIFGLSNGAICLVILAGWIAMFLVSLNIKHYMSILGGYTMGMIIVFMIYMPPPPA